MSHEEVAYRIFGDLPEEYMVDEFDADAVPYHRIALGGCGHNHRPFESCPDRDDACGVVGCCH